MSTKPARGVGFALELLSQRVTLMAGSSWAVAIAGGIVLAWALSGPLFGFSDTWQLVINTGTTVVTFLMVFLIQRSQNKDSQAVHLKLNEIVAALDGASNRLIGAEGLTEEELETLRVHFRELAKMSKRETDIRKSHSIDEAQERHRLKTARATSLRRLARRKATAS